MTYNHSIYMKEYKLKNKERLKIKAKEYRLKNKELLKIKAKEYKLKNKENLKIKAEEYRLKNKERIKIIKKKYRLKHIKKITEYMKEWRLKNKEHLKTKAKEYYLKNQEELKQFRKEWVLKNKNYYNLYLKNRKKTDPIFKLNVQYRSALSRSLKKNKTLGSIEYLGCTIPKFWEHLEKQFTPGMTRENYGKWHLDHIRPISSFDFTNLEQQKICWHYTNFQPMWAIDNMKKGAKYDLE
jgi:hypothetical protein